MPSFSLHIFCHQIPFYSEILLDGVQIAFPLRPNKMPMYTVMYQLLQGPGLAFGYILYKLLNMPS